MLITAAEERKKGLTALYIDGEYAVSVDTVTLISSGKKAGSEISDEELYELIGNSRINRAKEKALYLMEYRSRTRKEIWDRLVPLFGETAAQAALDRLEELGLINDESYARELAEQLITKKHYSRDRTVYELIKKGIDKETAEEIADEYEVEPCQQIRALIETKYARAMSDEKGRARTVNSLRAMGFRWSDIREVMSDYEEYDD